jgi:hypothetical protein
MENSSQGITPASGTFRSELNKRTSASSGTRLRRNLDYRTRVHARALHNSPCTPHTPPVRIFFTSSRAAALRAAAGRAGPAARGAGGRPGR